MEILLVPAVIAILLAAVAPRFAATSLRLRAERTAFEFAQLLRYAHERAVAQGETVAWRWDEFARRARVGIVVLTGPASLPPECELEHRELTPPVESVAVREDVGIAVLRDGTPDVCVNFFPDGTGDPTTLHLLHTPHEYTITVNGTTSQVLLSARAVAR